MPRASDEGEGLKMWDKSLFLSNFKQFLKSDPVLGSQDSEHPQGCSVSLLGLRKRLCFVLEQLGKGVTQRKQSFAQELPLPHTHLGKVFLSKPFVAYDFIILPGLSKGTTSLVFITWCAPPREQPIR